MSYPSKTEFDNLRNSLPVTYQTRGNYAFRTDLASNINTALRNVNTALAAYAKKNDIPIVPANVATKTDLASYALASDLGKYQPAGRYVSPSELENYQTKGDYASAKDLVSYAKSSDLTNYQPKGEYALSSNLDGYQVKGSYQTAGNYALQTDLAGYQVRGDYALASNLDGYQPKGSYQTAGSYALQTDLAGYQPKGNYALQPTAGNYALRTDLVNFQVRGDYALASNLAGYQPKGDYALASNLAGSYALKTDLAIYALSKDLATLQGKGNYQTAGSYALQPTAGNYALQPTSGSYALQTDLANYALQTALAGYAKTAGATTFGGQATFDKNAIVKTEGTIPFDVLGTGGLRVSGGGLTVTGDSTFGGNSTFSGSLAVTGNSTFGGNLAANHVFLESGGDPSMRLGPAIKDTGNARLNVQDKAGAYMRFFAGTTETGSITRDGSTTALNVGKVNAESANIKGTLSLALDNKNGGIDLTNTTKGSGGIYMANSDTEYTTDSIAGDMVIKNNKGTMRFLQGSGGSAMTIDSNNKVNFPGKVSAGNASITNLTVGNFNMTGAPTFNALATFDNNATVKTIANTPFQVTGAGGLRVTGGNLSAGTITAGTLHLGTLNVSSISAASILGSNATIGNLNMSGTSTFKALATFENNATVTTIANTPFQVTGAGGLRVTGGSLSAGASTFKGLATFDNNATVTTTVNNPFKVTGTGGFSIEGGGAFINGGGEINGGAVINGGLKVIGQVHVPDGIVYTPGDTFAYGKYGMNHYGLKWGEGDSDGATALLSSYGGIKMFTNGGQRLNIAKDGYATFAGGATINGSLNVGGGLTVESGGADIKGLAKFDNSVNLNLTANGGFELTNTTKGSGGIYMANSDTRYTTDSIGGDMVIRNNKGTMRFLQGSGGSAMTIDSNNTVNFPSGASGKIQTPNGQLKINQHGIQFGGNNTTGKELNSAQISAGLHIADSLNIVGMGSTVENRKVNMWAEGGFQVSGPLTAKKLTASENAEIKGDLTVGGTIHTNKIMIGNRFSIHYEEPSQSLIIQDMQGPKGAKGVYMRPASTSWQGLG